MSFSASIPTFGWVNSGGALMFGITGTMAITVTGVQVLGVAAGIGFEIGKLVSNYVFKNSGMTFMDYFELGILDTNAIFAAVHAFIASWYTFIPSLATSASRGITKALGNKGIGWF